MPGRPVDDGRLADASRLGDWRLRRGAVEMRNSKRYGNGLRSFRRAFGGWRLGRGQGRTWPGREPREGGGRSRRIGPEKLILTLILLLLLLLIIIIIIIIIQEYHQQHHDNDKDYTDDDDNDDGGGRRAAGGTWWTGSRNTDRYYYNTNRYYYDNSGWNLVDGLVEY